MSARRVKRKRVSLACRTCRRQKIRCDGVRPRCGTCERRRDNCNYEAENLRAESREAQSTWMHFGLSQNQLAPNAANIASITSGPESLSILDAHDKNSPSVTAMGLASGPPDTNHDSEEFFGDSSTISFIKQLQDTLEVNLPGYASKLPYGVSPMPADHHPISRFQTGSTLPEHLLTSLPPRQLADHLIDCYFSKIHTLYPFIHKDAFYAIYRESWDSSSLAPEANAASGLGLGDPCVKSITFYYGLNAIFALGCQFSALFQEEREKTSEAFFRLCKPALDMEFLEKGDLALCQTLLLMAHYLQASRTPNRCWHVISTACRVGQALGLHSSSGDKTRSFAEIQIRRRVWHGCVMLDLAVSTILGRPPMISQESTIPLPQAIDDCYLTTNSAICTQPPGVFSCVAWFIETLKLHYMLRKILAALYDNTGSREAESGTDGKADPLRQMKGIIEIDSQLQQFKDALPPELDWDTGIRNGDMPSFLREKYLLRARFCYLKLLLYRPVLVRTLRDHPKTQHTQTNNILRHGGIHSKFLLDCSFYCVRAAIDLACVVHQTCNTELSSVWFYNVFYSFTAGSVILLAQLSPSIVEIVARQDLEDAWDKCQDALNSLSRHGSTVKDCAETLSLIRSKCQTAGTGLQEDRNTCTSTHVDSGKDALGGSCLTSDSIFLTDDLFRDFDFSEDTLFDPFWFNLQF